MNRFSTFIFGFILGCGLMFVGLKYHIVHASDGLHMVPKTTARFSIYTDVRKYSVDDWRNNRDLLVDITNFGSDELKEEAAKSAVGNLFDSAWENFTDMP